LTAGLRGGNNKRMTPISIPISDENRARLESLAQQAGVSAEEFLRRSVEQLLERPDAAFSEAAGHVLRKNAELYRRLA
jgi:predicted transcriptional regulator